MRLRWPVWGGRTARRSADSDDDVEHGPTRRRRTGGRASRPRVARAAEAARAARVGAPTQAGDEMARVWRARDSGPLWSERHAGARGEAGISAHLLWATADAARANGREPEDVWAEALDAWLADRGANHQQEGATALAGRAQDVRRIQAWDAIDATLGQLRAS